MSKYVDFHYMPLEGKITGKQVLKQTEDAINDLGQHVYEIDIDNEKIQEAIDTSNQAIETAEEALAVVTTNRAVWYNSVTELREAIIDNGIVAAIKGYAFAGDEGQAFYVVREKKSGDVDDGKTIIFLDAGNVAEIIANTGITNMFDFDEDGYLSQIVDGDISNQYGEKKRLASYEGQQEIVQAFNDVINASLDIKGNAESARTSAETAKQASDSLIQYLDTRESITAPIVDPTLTISGAAADAEVTGDELKKKADLELLQVLGIEPKTDAITFTFVTNGTGSLSESNGDYTITGQTSNTNAVVAYTELGNYNSYIITPYEYLYNGTLLPTLNSMIFPFYKNGNDVYGFRFLSATSIAIQRYNISTFSGGQVATITKTHGWTSGKPLLITIDGNNVSLYINGKLMYRYNYASLVSESGVTVGGYISTAFNRSLSTNSDVAFNNVQIFGSELNALQINEDIETIRTTTNLLKRGYHFSFDDVILVFQDLTNNAGVYSSIFENSFLADLKNLHDAFGSCFSFYCFYQNAVSNPTFTLSDATNAFASEFTANADWLRFGFHSYAQSTSYESGSTRENMIASDYDAVITQLIRITGSINCIDRIPRLHNYAGSLTACKAIRDTQCGVVGLLSAAAYSDVLERDSYYFDTDQNAYMAKHYKYYDAINSLVFIKTVYGVNSISTTNNYVKTQAKANMRDFMELFLHENQWTSGMKTMWTNIATTLAENGYVSNFYMDRLI